MLLSNRRLNRIISESIHSYILSEAIQSNYLRNWFHEHGGVKNRLNDPYFMDQRVTQDGLGDVTDDMILYTQEYPSKNDALNAKWRMKQPKSRFDRNDMDMQCYFTVYEANDGMCLLVGIDRNKMEIGSTWGGEATAKLANRMRNNGWNMKTRSNRYIDDSDTYYYGDKARDFGLTTNHMYKGMLKHNQDIRDNMTDDEWNDYMMMRKQRRKNYLDKNYPKR